DGQGNLWVTDGGNRRVLRFAAGDLAKGNTGDALHANLVLGQVDFATTNQPAPTTSTAATTTNAFAIPVAIGFDAAGNLFVSDSSTDTTVSRVLAFTPPFSTNQNAARVIAPVRTSQDAIGKTTLAMPASIFSAPGASKIGVLDTFHNRVLAFDSYDKWPASTV